MLPTFSTQFDLCIIACLTRQCRPRALRCANGSAFGFAHSNISHCLHAFILSPPPRHGFFQPGVVCCQSHIECSCSRSERACVRARAAPGSCRCFRERPQLAPMLDLATYHPHSHCTARALVPERRFGSRRQTGTSRRSRHISIPTRPC